MSRVVDQAFQCLLSTLETDQRLVEAFLSVRDPTEFNQRLCIRRVDIRVDGARSSTLLITPDCP